MSQSRFAEPIFDAARSPVIWGGQAGFELARVTRAGRVPQTCIGPLHFVLGKSDYHEWFLDWSVDGARQERQLQLTIIAVEDFMSAQVRRHLGIALDFARLIWLPVPRESEPVYDYHDPARKPSPPLFTNREE